MKPGVFVGKDGNTYRWLGDSRGYVMLQVWSDELDDWVTSPMNPEDLPDAEAALDSYTSFLASFPKAVPLGCFDGGFELVLWGDDHGDAEVRRTFDGHATYPRSSDVAVFAAAAYQKGLEDGRKERDECEALREQVKVLKELVLGAYLHDDDCELVAVYSGDWWRIYDAAKAVKL